MKYFYLLIVFSSFSVFSFAQNNWVIKFNYAILNHDVIDNKNILDVQGGELISSKHYGKKVKQLFASLPELSEQEFEKVFPRLTAKESVSFT